MQVKHRAVAASSEFIHTEASSLYDTLYKCYRWYWSLCFRTLMMQYTLLYLQHYFVSVWRTMVTVCEVAVVHVLSSPLATAVSLTH